jgi:hypothetical protein
MATNNDWRSATCGECKKYIHCAGELISTPNGFDTIRRTSKSCPDFTPREREEAKENG